MFTVTNIAFLISGIIFLLLLLIFKFPKKQKNKKVIYIFILISIVIGSISYMFMYINNNNNIKYLSSFTKYDKIEVLDVFLSDEESRFEFIVYYDNEKLKCFLNHNIPRDFEKFGYNFYLNDITGETVYNIFWDENKKEYIKLKQIFILSNINKFEKFLKYKYEDSDELKQKLKYLKAEK